MTRPYHLIPVVSLLLLPGCAGANRPPAAGVQPPAAPMDVASSEDGVIPVGQQVDVRLQEVLSTETAIVEDRISATTVVDLVQSGTILVPAGSIVRGYVRDVQRPGTFDRSGRLTLAFDELAISGQTYPIAAMPLEAFESRGVVDEAETVGAGGIAGAILGGIVGGVGGAVVGAAVGAGGVIAGTEGSEVVLPAGTIVRLRMDTPVEIR